MSEDHEAIQERFLRILGMRMSEKMQLLILEAMELGMTQKSFVSQIDDAWSFVEAKLKAHSESNDEAG